MPVLDSPHLAELIRASAEARAAAARAIARSEALQPLVADQHHRSMARRMASRPHQAYVRLTGVVEGAAVEAVVRTDGSVVASRVLLRRAGLLVAMGERFDAGQIEASVGDDAVATALTLVRACDWVEGLELVTSGPAGREAN